MRRLQVGGRACTWTAAIRCVPGEDDCYRGIRLRVWGAGKKGRVLQVELLSRTPPGPWGACATDGAYPTSEDVRAIVEYGLAHGWEADAVGGRFVLTEREHGGAFELEAFLLTDQESRPA